MHIYIVNAVSNWAYAASNERVANNEVKRTLNEAVVD
jgi:hypothetical protein